MNKSLGLIETIGLTAGIVAADTAVKSANVELIGYELTKGSGMTVIKLEGDVGAVTAAIASAAAAASAVGRVISTKVIPRPSESLELMIENSSTIGWEKDSLEEDQASHIVEVYTPEVVLSESKETEAILDNNSESDIIEDNPSEDKVDNAEESSDETSIVDIESSEGDKGKSQAPRKKGNTKKNGQKNGPKGSKVDKDEQENK